MQIPRIYYVGQIFYGNMLLLLPPLQISEAGRHIFYKKIKFAERKNLYILDKVT